MGSLANARDMIYLDNNATTFLDASVVDTMIGHLKCADQFGNGSSAHVFGTRSRHAIEQCREQVRRCLNAEHADEIVFTSGGTESNNMAVHGVVRRDEWPGRPVHVITSPFEHPSVSDTLEQLQFAHGHVRVSFVRVDANGIVDLEHFRQLLSPDTRLVTIMHSNNEIGLVSSRLV
jgi:cysteine desulfurase